MAKRPRFRIAKHEGDDLYSWALFDNGRVMYNGMSRSEAAWRKGVEEQKAKETVR